MVEDVTLLSNEKRCKQKEACSSRAAEWQRLWSLQRLATTWILYGHRLYWTGPQRRSIVVLRLCYVSGKLANKNFFYTRPWNLYKYGFLLSSVFELAWTKNVFGIKATYFLKATPQLLHGRSEINIQFPLHIATYADIQRWTWEVMKKSM